MRHAEISRATGLMIARYAPTSDAPPSDAVGAVTSLSTCTGSGENAVNKLSLGVQQHHRRLLNSPHIDNQRTHDNSG